MDRELKDKCVIGDNRYPGEVTSINPYRQGRREFFLKLPIGNKV